MPKVSIIVPNYNHDPYLEQRLESILCQTFRDFELILLDDASTDGSQQTLASYAATPKVSHYVINEKNSGSPFKQWAKGINLSSGEYIWIAESDDVAEPEFLEKLLQVITDKKVEIAYCQSWKIDEAGNKLRSGKTWTDDLHPNLWEDYFVLEPERVHRYMMHKNIIPNVSAVLFSQKVYDCTGGVRTNYKLTGDWDLWIRMSYVSPVGFIPEHLNYFRLHAQSTRNHNNLQKRKLRLNEGLRIVKLLKHYNLVEKKKLNEKAWELRKNNISIQKEILKKRVKNLLSGF